MSVLGDERQAIKEAIGGDYDVHTCVPEAIRPPAAFIAPDDPYLEKRQEDPFGTIGARFEVWIIRGAGTNDKSTTDLDDEIERVCAALHAAGFAVTGVDQPFQYQVQGGNYLSAIIHVETGVNLTT